MRGLKRAKWAAAKLIGGILSVNCVSARPHPPGQLGMGQAVRSASMACLDNLGDAVMATPTVEALKLAFPFCRTS